MKIHSTFSSLVIAIFFVIATNHHVISSSSASSPLNNKHTPPTASPSLLPSYNSVRGGGGGDDDNKRTSSADATSTSSPSPSTYNDEFPKKSSANNNINTSTNSSPSRTTKSTSSSSSNSNSVTFLYELYEHEIYSPSTDSWADVRFTQSPNTGGGGRETSLNPQSCTPPRNYYFDSEWKIDMANNYGSGEYSKDGFGWEYYVGRYDGLGRRRRRWVRNLRRVSGLSSAGVAMAKSLEAKKKLQQQQKDRTRQKQKKVSSKSSSSSLNKPKKSATYQPPPTFLKSIQDSYNFKGFGWSFYKSLVFRKSFGAAFRIPLSANFDGYDKYLAAPYISSSTYFGYPLVIATFLNVSIPLEAIKWILGGVVWKISWGLAVLSAFVRSVVESVVWVILGPWRVWRGVITMMTVLANKVGFGGGKEEDTMQEKEKLLNDDTGLLQAANVTIETHIEMNNSSEYSSSGTDNKHEEMPTVSANAVADGPRGGAAINTAVKDSTTVSETTKSTKEEMKEHKPLLTLSGNEVPTFHRPYPMQYSYTIQERLGVCISWRFSAERGYEFRTNFVYTCLPTRLFWEQVDMERKRRLDIVKERVVGSSIWGRIRKNDPSSAKFVGTIEADKIGDKISTTDLNKSKSSRSLSKSKSQQSQSSSALSTFLTEHSSTMGVSSGFPLPIHPFVSANLLFTMSSFYYGWLFRYIRSLFVLPLPSPRSSSGSVRSKELKSSSSQYYDDASISSSSNSGDEKLVSFALKKTLKEGTEQHLASSVASSDDDESDMGTNSTQIDFSDSDTEDFLANVTEVNVAGI